MSAQNLGFYNTSSTRTRVRFLFSTHAAAGANVAPLSSFEAADLRIYRANDGAAVSATERSNSSGITMTSPFDSLTGFHAVDIDLTDNTDSGFYAAGYTYSVVLSPDSETIDGQTITGVVLATFEIGVPVVALANAAHGGSAAVLTVERIVIASTTTNEPGLKISGNGSAAGMQATGGATGPGIKGIGGATSGEGILLSTTSGDGIKSAPTAGHGMNLVANGTSKHGLLSTGGGAGTSDGIKGAAGSGGTDIRGTITGNLAGTIDGVSAAGAATFFLIDSTKHYSDAVAGSVVKEIADNAGSGGGGPSAATIADAVWDEARAGHVTAGTYGEGINVVSLATAAVQAIWDALTSALTTSGSIGKMLVDKLGSVSGQVAGQSEVTAIQNNTRVVITAPEVIERPDSGTVTYRIDLYLYDEVGNMEAPDSAPTVALVNQAGTDRSGRLDSTTMSSVSTGRYRVIYTAAVGDSLEQLNWTFTVVEGSATRLYGRQSLIVDTTAVDFTSSDRTKLDAIYGKLPSKSYLTGTANSDGDVQMSEATGDFPGAVATATALGTQAKADVNAEADTALADINLDHLLKLAVDTNLQTTVQSNSVLGYILAKSAVSNYVRTTDSLEAQGDANEKIRFALVPCFTTTEGTTLRWIGLVFKQGEWVDVHALDPTATCEIAADEYAAALSFETDPATITSRGWFELSYNNPNLNDDRHYVYTATVVISGQTYTFADCLCNLG